MKKDFLEHIIYNLSNFDIKNLVLNKRKNETFEDQQNQGKRPRFSIPLRILHNYNPIIIGNIDNW